MKINERTVQINEKNYISPALRRLNRSNIYSLLKCRQLFRQGKSFKNVERNSDTETTFNYSDGAVSAPTEYNSYSSEVSDFELKLFRNYYKNNSDKRVLCLRLPILLSHSDYLQTVPQNKARQILSMR